MHHIERHCANNSTSRSLLVQSTCIVLAFHLLAQNKSWESCFTPFGTSSFFTSAGNAVWQPTGKARIHFWHLSQVAELINRLHTFPHMAPSLPSTRAHTHTWTHTNTSTHIVTGSILREISSTLKSAAPPIAIFYSSKNRTTATCCIYSKYHLLRWRESVCVCASQPHRARLMMELPNG